jgi:REP element-mobilizing transposase RayT
LPAYDYAQPGAYFVTIVTDQRRQLFGRVHREVIQLSRMGEVAEACWRQIPTHFTQVRNPVFVVMPNRTQPPIPRREHRVIQIGRFSANPSNARI